MRTETAVPGRSAVAEKPGNPLSFFEFWPGWLFYTPVVMHWMLLGLRYGDFSLPTAANPQITTGGLCGESKLSILDQVGRETTGCGRPGAGRPPPAAFSRARTAPMRPKPQWQRSGCATRSWSSPISAATAPGSGWCRTGQRWSNT